MGLFRACSDSKSQGLEVLSKPMFCHPNCREVSALPWAKSGLTCFFTCYSPNSIRRRVRIWLAHQPRFLQWIQSVECAPQAGFEHPVKAAFSLSYRQR